MGYSLSTSEADCYPGTTVLVNKLGIKEQKALDNAEYMSAAVHSEELKRTGFTEPFTFDFYREIHRKLFGDIYDWAGEIRTANISKKGTRFCEADRIAALGKAKFAYLQSRNEFTGISQDEYIHELADFYNDLNMLHPFREGNGRTQRLFFSLLIRRGGNSINFADCDADSLMMATIQAANGVISGLEEFFRDTVNFTRK